MLRAGPAGGQAACGLRAGAEPATAPIEVAAPAGVLAAAGSLPGPDSAIAQPITAIAVTAPAAVVAAWRLFVCIRTPIRTAEASRFWPRPLPVGCEVSEVQHYI